MARVAGQHVSMGGTYSWLAHADAIDSTTMVTDETGAVVWDQVGGADIDFQSLRSAKLSRVRLRER